MINLTSKLGEFNAIEHNKGSKMYRQNKVILDCIMPSIPFKNVKKTPKNFFFFSQKTDMVLGKMWLLSIGNFPLEKGRNYLLLIFIKINFIKNAYRNTNRVSNSLDPDQAQYFVGPDLGSKCLQWLSDEASIGRVKFICLV